MHLLTLLGSFLIASTALLSLFPKCVFADAKISELPAEYTDFAINPDTGDIAAVNPNDNTATLFRSAYFSGDTTATVGSVTFGNAPCSITFKKFQDKSYFVIGCLRDSNIYLLDAATFKPAKKIGLNGSAVNVIVSSHNANDPFVYYICLPNQGSTIGRSTAGCAVSVRTMSDCGIVLHEAGDCAVAASGRFIYRRRVGSSPSGFESLQLQSSFDSDKPVFVIVYSEHADAATYLPDPFEQYTAVAENIYTSDLSKKLASFDFQPKCFFKSRPIIIGEVVPARIQKRRSKSKSQTEEPEQRITLRAASWNTLTPVGQPVALPPSFAEIPTDPILAITSRLEAPARGQLVHRRRLFADDKNGLLHYAYRNQVATVPLADFKAPDEPSLLVEAESPDSLQVGLRQTIKLKQDPALQLEFSNLPKGMTKNAEGLVWSPTNDQVGINPVIVKIKGHGIDRQQTLELFVTAPSLQLPFTARGMSVSDDGLLAVCWSGPPSQFGPGSDALAAEKSKVVIINLVNRQILLTKDLPFQVDLGVIDNQNVYFVDKDRTKVEVFDNKELQSKKTIFANTSISNIAVVSNRRLVVQEREMAVSYSLPTFERLFVSSIGINSASDNTNDSLLENPRVDGVLINDEGKPELLVSVGHIRMLLADHGSQSRNQPFNPLSSDSRRQMMEERSRRFRRSISGTGQVHTSATQRIGTLPVAATIESNLEGRQVGPRYRHDLELTVVLSDLVTNTAKQRIELVKSPYYMPENGSTPLYPPLIGTSQRLVVAAHYDRLYFWSPDPSQFSSYPTPLQFKKNQSAILVSGRGKTELRHVLEGGKPPYKITFPRATAGIEFDEASGTVLLDNQAIIAKAEEQIIKDFSDVRSVNHPTVIERLHRYINDNSGRVERALGRKPEGPLVAIPIAVYGSDSEAQSTVLHYYVLVEVPLAPVQAALEKQEAEQKALRDAHRKEAEEKKSSEIAGASSGDINTKMDRLQRKVEALEERLDLLTREINQLRKNPPPPEKANQPR